MASDRSLPCPDADGPPAHRAALAQTEDLEAQLRSQNQPGSLGWAADGSAYPILGHSITYAGWVADSSTWLLSSAGSAATIILTSIASVRRAMMANTMVVLC